MTEQDSLFRETLFPAPPSDLREWKGSGGPRGLQNRCPDVIHREVGSTPMHSRQVFEYQITRLRRSRRARRRTVMYTAARRSAKTVAAGLSVKPRVAAKQRSVPSGWRA